MVLDDFDPKTSHELGPRGLVGGGAVVLFAGPAEDGGEQLKQQGVEQGVKVRSSLHDLGAP
jgi:hypothetical protein